MKLGRSWEEQKAHDDEQVAKGRVWKRVFAFIPRYCFDSMRFVWLEHVWRSRRYSRDYEEWISTYYEEKV